MRVITKLRYFAHRHSLALLVWMGCNLAILPIESLEEGYLQLNFHLFYICLSKPSLLRALLHDFRPYIMWTFMFYVRLCNPTLFN